MSSVLFRDAIVRNVEQDSIILLVYSVFYKLQPKNVTDMACKFIAKALGRPKLPKATQLKLLQLPAWLEFYCKQTLKSASLRCSEPVRLQQRHGKKRPPPRRRMMTMRMTMMRMTRMTKMMRTMMKTRLRRSLGFCFELGSSGCVAAFKALGLFRLSVQVDAEEMERQGKREKAKDAKVLRVSRCFEEPGVPTER